MTLKINPIWYLCIGIILIVASHLTYGIAILAWISSVPFLLYLKSTKGHKSKWLFIITLIIAWSLAVLKIVTPPLQPFMVFLFSIPIAIIQLPGYLLWAKFNDKKYASFLFPATMVVMEWIQYRFTPFASWGVAAYTQMDNLLLIQSVSLFGLAGLSFLIYWINIVLVNVISKQTISLKAVGIPLLVLVIVIVFGSLRYTIYKADAQKTITVATVSTDSQVGGLPLPSKADTDKDISTLFARTRLAAHNRAKLIVWNEASIAILPKDENSWKDSLKSISKELKITLVAAYVMPVAVSPLMYENKYLFILPDGKIAYTYHKHQPVPGEPSIKGTEVLQNMDVEKSKVGAAICYDYDYPYLAKNFAAIKTDIIGLPSSDWRGIDPIHTKMAAFRAIEQGHSILRSTRLGLSAAITPIGEMSSQSSYFDKNNKIMMGQLPQKGITTFYSIIGDVLVYLCIGYLMIFMLALKFKNKL